ncbi:potassium-transporting ATPase subunit KdpB [Nocardiopsis flavescens]|uniref:potassium-transporting ATPase subunit KdpB n=1 Tax=Nocardiopsis flavescens TaxID=758803 RepID=UPI003660EC02
MSRTVNDTPKPATATVTAATAAGPDRARPGALGAPLLRRALADSVRKLDPRVQFRNPVMFVVLLGSALATVLSAAALFGGETDRAAFGGLLTLFLWATLLFANFAEALAEGRGKARAAALRATRSATEALVRTPDGTLVSVPGTELRVGDECVVSAGGVVPGDGDVVEGIATVDESAITGESAPVVRESGGDRSAVTGGTTVLSDRIVVRITTPPGETFLDRMIALVEGAERQRTPNEVALTILLCGLTAVFLVAVVTLQPLAAYSGARQGPVVLIALLVCLIPTTIGALLSAIGIAGMERLVRRNVMATSGRAVEAAGDVTTLLLDKTGTITFGNRRAAEFLSLPGVPDAELAEAARRSSLADGTPEGRSIVDLAAAGRPSGDASGESGVPVPFTARTRMSGLDDGDRRVRKGAVDAVARWTRENGGEVPDRLRALAQDVSDRGGTPLAVAEVPAQGAPARLLGVVHLKDTVKPGMRERFEQLRTLGIRTVMVTGDNPGTAAVIAREAGVDDFLAEAAPEDKLALIRREQEGGALVAMTGDGTNDAPALARADVGVAMNTGTQAAREAGNMVDLDSDPTKLIEIVHIGKQLLVTRGALTTFSLANDVAKYFAILPAMFAASLPGLERMNVMGLASAESAILSAVVFNALVIVALVPLALRGVAFRPLSAAALLRRNLLVYGLGGLVAPFVGIKLIDLLISALGVI